MCEEYTGPDAVVDPADPDPQLRQLTEENKKLREQIELPLQQKRRLSFQSSFFWA